MRIGGVGRTRAKTRILVVSEDDDMIIELKYEWVEVLIVELLMKGTVR